MTAKGPTPPRGLWPIVLQSVHLAAPGWTLWGTAPDGDGDWLLARLGQVLLFDTATGLRDFVDRGSTGHSLAALPDWATLAREHLADEIVEFDFDEDGMWLFDRPATWTGPRRAEMVDRLNLLWDAANQFDDKKYVTALLGGGRGSLLGRLADALMESDEPTLAELPPTDIRTAYRDQARNFFARCIWGGRKA